MEKRFTLAKAVTRTVIDFCVLPGTAVGAEILWIYSLQWKNKASLVVLAALSFIYSNMHVVIADSLSTKTNESGNTI